MKRLTLTTLLLIAMAVCVQAQENPVKDRKFFGYDWEMTKLLSFTPEQQKQWKEIQSNANTEINRVKADESLSEAAKNEKLNALWKERYYKHEALLTAAQKVKAEEFKQLIRNQQQQAKEKNGNLGSNPL